MHEESAAMTGSSAVERFAWRDWLAAAGLFAVSLAIRVPFRSHFAYHWDSAQFALAVEHFDVSLGLPHRPGYFLFILLGRIVNLFAGDPHTSLMWVNMVAGAALAALGYLLGGALFGRDCGWLTGGILATSPLCWFQSEVLFSTILDSTLVTATILVCWRAIRRGGGWPWVVAVGTMLALQAGVRQQTTPMLCPVWLYTFWKFPRPRWRKLVVGVAVAGVLCAAWFIPMVQLSGGLGVYLRLYPERVRMDAPLTPFGGGGFEVVMRNLAFVVGCCWIGLFAAGVLAGAEVLLWLRGKGDRWRAIACRSEELRFLAWWIVPMMLFGIIVITVMPGYVLCYFPGLAILAGLALCRLAGKIDHALDGRWRRGLLLVVGGITVVNVAVFCLSPPGRMWWRAGLPTTDADIREHDRQLSRWFGGIRERFQPNEAVICHHGQSYFFGLRQFQYYLPEYENWLLTTDRALRPPFNQKLWCATNRRVEFVDRFNPGGHKTIIFVVPPGASVDGFATALDVHQAQRWEIPDSAPLYTLTVGTESDAVTSRLTEVP
jgi:hypothetical protein